MPLLITPHAIIFAFAIIYAIGFRFSCRHDAMLMPMPAPIRCRHYYADYATHDALIIFAMPLRHTALTPYYADADMPLFYCAIIAMITAPLIYFAIMPPLRHYAIIFISRFYYCHYAFSIAILFHWRLILIISFHYSLIIDAIMSFRLPFSLFPYYFQLSHYYISLSLFRHTLSFLYWAFTPFFDIISILPLTPLRWCCRWLFRFHYFDIATIDIYFTPLRRCHYFRFFIATLIDIDSIRHYFHARCCFAIISIRHFAFAITPFCFAIIISMPRFSFRHCFYAIDAFSPLLFAADIIFIISLFRHFSPLRRQILFSLLLRDDAIIFIAIDATLIISITLTLSMPRCFHFFAISLILMLLPCHYYAAFTLTLSIIAAFAMIFRFLPLILAFIIIIDFR